MRWEHAIRHRAVCKLLLTHLPQPVAPTTSTIALYNVSIAMCALGDHDGAMRCLDRAVDTCTTAERLHHPYLFQARAMLLRRKVRRCTAGVGTGRGA